MITTDIETGTRCTIDHNCTGPAVIHDVEAGEFSCEGHKAQFTEGAARFAAETGSTGYNGPKLVALTGNRVHYPAYIGQKTTYQTACAPTGRMGARQMRLRFTVETKWAVDCKSCLKTSGPKASA